MSKHFLFLTLIASILLVLAISGRDQNHLIENVQRLGRSAPAPKAAHALEEGETGSRTPASVPQKVKRLDIEPVYPSIPES